MPRMPDDRIVQYILENRDRYSRKAIRDQLEAAGHDPWAIHAAFVAAEAEGQSGGPSRDLRGEAAMVVIAAYIGTYVAFALFSQRNFYGGVLAIFLLGGALLSLVIVALTPALQQVRSPEAAPALAIGLAVPLVILVGIAGLCIAAVNPFTPYSGGSPWP